MDAGPAAGDRLPHPPSARNPGRRGARGGDLRDPLASAIVVGAFGLARAVPQVAMAGAATDNDVAAVAQRLESVGSSAAPRLANGLVLVALAVSAAAKMPDVPGESVELYRLLVARNIGLVVLVAVVVADPVSPFPPLPAIRVDTVLPFSLVAAGIALALAVGRRLTALGTR